MKHQALPSTARDTESVSQDLNDLDCVQEIPFDRWDWLMIAAAIAAVCGACWLLRSAAAVIG